LFKILIDTCVWLDLAKDPKNLALVKVVETLVQRGDVALIVPRVVLDEFERNKARVAREGAQSLSSALRRVREAVWRLDAPNGGRTWPSAWAILISSCPPSERAFLKGLASSSLFWPSPRS
jgi:PIN domain